MMDLDQLLGIDKKDPLAQRAQKLLEEDRDFVRKLVHRRKSLGLTQKEVARRMDVGQPAVARIESGVRDLHQSTIRRYAMAVEALLVHTVIPDTCDRRPQASTYIESAGVNTSSFNSPEAWLNADTSLDWPARTKHGAANH